jgi:hypothetical protein
MLTKRDACRLLGISERTLRRRMADGTYKFTRNGEGQYAEVRFTYADLGLPEPTPAFDFSPGEKAIELQTADEITLESEPEPAREPVTIHRYANGDLVAMSAADSAAHARRDRNLRIVQARREHLLTNLKWEILSGTPEAVARQRIDAQCAELLRQLNRRQHEN